MSAESPRKPIHTGGHIVVPQPVSDRTIIESVAGFISDVVPQVRIIFVLVNFYLANKHFKIIKFLYRVTLLFH